MGSTRFPGKPLAIVGGKPLLQYAVDAARESGLPFTVASQDWLISNWCYTNGIPHASTSDARNGTERAAIVNQAIKWDRVIILQCDEPDVTGKDLKRLDDYEDPCTVQTAMSERDWENLNSVAVLGGGGDCSVAMRFVRGVAAEEEEREGISRHVGVYFYARYMLDEYLRHPPTRAEESRSLEQLRTMALGYAWNLKTIPGPLRSVNVPEDVNQFKEDGITVR